MSNPTDVKHLSRELALRKFAEIASNVSSRSGPNLVFLKEHEDDSKIRELTRSFSDGVQTLNQSWADLCSGVVVVGGRGNSGKSTFLTNIQHGIIQENNGPNDTNFHGDLDILSENQTKGQQHHRGGN